MATASLRGSTVRLTASSQAGDGKRRHTTSTRLSDTSARTRQHQLRRPSSSLRLSAFIGSPLVMSSRRRTLSKRRGAVPVRALDEPPWSTSDVSSDSWAHEDDADFGGMDWRTFRAKLVAQNQALQNVSGVSGSQQTALGLEIWQDRMSMDNWALLARQNPQLAREVPWVHSTAGPEVGGILLASPSLSTTGVDRFSQAVVLVTQHDSRGSAGLILNKPSGYTLKKALSQVKGVEGALAVFAGNAIYVGGNRSEGRTLHLLHGHPIPGAVELMPGVYLGGVETAAEEVLGGALPASDFRFFVGKVEWSPGKLEDEISRGCWFPGASARSLILKQCLQLPRPLWKEMMELMGGEFAETAKREYDEA